MIIQYDDRPNLTPEQRIQSLRDNVQLAFNELTGNSDNLYKSLLTALGEQTDQLNTDFASVAERIDQEASTLAEAVSGVLDRLNDIESDVATLQSQYTALEARVTALENA